MSKSGQSQQSNIFKYFSQISSITSLLFPRPTPRSFSDPTEAQGLAHFLEHMVFMGSEAFPKEEEFDDFVSRCGGYTNAHTDAEQTCYVFEVLAQFLEPALERFSHFFRDPLLRESRWSVGAARWWNMMFRLLLTITSPCPFFFCSTSRELEAVDSEFIMNQQSDGVRRAQLLCHLARDGHPMHAFGWGNSRSLRDLPSKVGGT